MINNNRCSCFQLIVAGLSLLSIATSANAALVSRLNGEAVYDTDLNITWIADANLAASNTFGVSGIGGVKPGNMSWYTAQSWITALNASDGGNGYLDFNDWRLPATLHPDATCSGETGWGTSWGYNCTGSELGHLFYTELSGVAGSGLPWPPSVDPDLALFKNLLVLSPTESNAFWSGTETASYLGSAYYFFFANGYQSGENKTRDSSYYAWAVRDGDVAAVPIPATFWLFGSGVISMLGFMRHRNSPQRNEN